MSTLRTDTIMLGLLLTLSALGLHAVPEQRHPAATAVNVAPTELPITEVPVEKVSAPAILPKVTPIQSELPDFAAIRDVKTKKQAFFAFMLPLIRDSNQAVLNDRFILENARMTLQTREALDAEVLHKIGGLSNRYRVRPGSDLLNTIDELLLKVDVVPESLVLAQAAKESGWGTSRFARKANNLFGVWCFTPGCGLTPLSRDEGLTHEVARYDTVRDSVSAYIRTINSNPAYIELRQIRADSRSGGGLTGLALAEGLVRYSSRGLDYVREIQQMIRVNKLHEYTLPV